MFNQKYPAVGITFMIACGLFTLSSHALLPTETDHIACDLDLENIEAIVPYLPEKCQQIYEERVTNKERFDLYTAEARKFGQFFKKLDVHERKDSNNNNNEELDQYPFDEVLRKRIYTDASLNDCYDVANSTESTFFNCIMLKLDGLIAAVPQ